MMDATLFRKKYLGEVTLKNGEHVKFLYPISERSFECVKIKAKNIWKNYRQNKTIGEEYQWAVFDNLNLEQFQIVLAAISIYGKQYWKRLWQAYLEKNKKN